MFFLWSFTAAKQHILVGLFDCYKWWSEGHSKSTLTSPVIPACSLCIVGESGVQEVMPPSLRSSGFISLLSPNCWDFPYDYDWLNRLPTRKWHRQSFSIDIQIYVYCYTLAILRWNPGFKALWVRITMMAHVTILVLLLSCYVIRSASGRVNIVMLLMYK